MRTSQDGNSSMPGFNVDLDKANRGGSLEVSPVLNKVNEDGGSYVDERTEESKRGCNSEVNVKRNVSQEIKVMTGPFEASDETKLQGGDSGITMGTWQDAKAEDIEDYLLGTQRRFIKYKLNIFYLNKVSNALTVSLCFNSLILNFCGYLVRATNPALLPQDEKGEDGPRGR